MGQVLQTCYLPQYLKGIEKMDIEEIKQLAVDVNNVASASFQSGKEYTEGSLLTEIEQLKTQRHSLLSTIQNALVSLAIINMPVREGIGDVVTNNELMKIMADSFREAIAKAKQEAVKQ